MKEIYRRLLSIYNLVKNVSDKETFRSLWIRPSHCSPARAVSSLCYLMNSTEIFLRSRTVSSVSRSLQLSHGRTTNSGPFAL